jgi:hypothetical protein
VGKDQIGTPLNSQIALSQIKDPITSASLSDDQRNKFSSKPGAIAPVSRADMNLIELQFGLQLPRPEVRCKRVRSAETEVFETEATKRWCRLRELQERPQGITTSPPAEDPQ